MNRLIIKNYNVEISNKFKQIALNYKKKSIQAEDTCKYEKPAGILEIYGIKNAA